MIKKVSVALKGLIVGGTMLVPGVSGGSMAMILGTYDELISSISSFFKHKRKSFFFLLLFCSGAVLGMVLFANPLGVLLEKYPKILMYFFIGAVAGSIPMMLRKARVKTVTWRVFLYPAIGIAAVALLSLLPEGLFSTDGSGVDHYILLFAAGLIAAVALVLPGISVSHMMVMLGLYEGILQTINSRSLTELLSLLPLVAGVLIGIVLSTKLLERAMVRHPQATYLVILGFLGGSVIDVFPGVPTGWEILICIVLFAVGFTAIYFLSRMEEKREEHEVKSI